jgi:hypothetical protein
MDSHQIDNWSKTALDEWVKLDVVSTDLDEFLADVQANGIKGFSLWAGMSEDEILKEMYADSGIKNSDSESKQTNIQELNKSIKQHALDYKEVNDGDNIL